ELSFHLAVRPQGAYRKQGDFIVEIDETFHDDAALVYPSAGHGVVPGPGHVFRTADFALALARAAHQRLDHAGVAYAAVDGGLQALQGIAELIRAGGYAQGLRRQAAYAFTVHGQA